MQKQRVEITRPAAFTVNVPVVSSLGRRARGRGGRGGGSQTTGRDRRGAASGERAPKAKNSPAARHQGMDQPYGVADALLDYVLVTEHRRRIRRRHGLDVHEASTSAVRVLDQVLTTRVACDGRIRAGRRDGSAAPSSSTRTATASALRYKLERRHPSAEESFDEGGTKYARGSWVVRALAIRSRRRPGSG